MSRARWVAWVMAAVLVAGACSGGDAVELSAAGVPADSSSDSSDPTTSSTAPEPAASTSEPPQPVPFATGPPDPGTMTVHQEPPPAAVDQPAPGEWTAMSSENSWQAARTGIDDPATLLILLVGGPPYVEGNPCTVDYRAVVEEGADEVRVHLQFRQPPWPPETDPDQRGCTAAGYSRSVLVTLDAPLAGRRVVDSAGVRPVVDGSMLARPTWLPEGWTEVTDGSRTRTAEDAWHWYRAWNEPTGDSDDPCQGGPAAIMLEEYWEEPDYRMPGRTPSGTHDIRGNQATYYSDDNGFDRLEWQEAGRYFVVGSEPRCIQDASVPEETLVRFARGLDIPPS